LVGLRGYFADSEVFIIDHFTLADPFRSRLPGVISDPWNWPGRLGWRPAHVPRPIPEGYLETVRTGTNHLEDPDLARVWDAVALVTRGPLWSKARWVAIWQLNTGAFDDEVERWVARNRDLYRPP
jgi:arabinofuranosyltransferase